MLCDALVKDQADLWLRLAQKLYESTGRRVRPEEIKAKFFKE